MGDMSPADGSEVQKIVTADKPRQRRGGAELRALIAKAARASFAEHGYAGATTRDIARRAGASEVLIYRYYGSKARLFDEVVFAPFDRLIGGFMDEVRDEPTDRRAGSERFTRSIYPFLKDNADLLRAIAKSGSGSGNAIAHGLDNYFERAADRIRAQYAHEGVEAEIIPEWGVRFSFGMLAAAVLFEDWFFPDGPPPEAQLRETLSHMLYKALSPAT